MPGVPLSCASLCVVIIKQIIAGISLTGSRGDTQGGTGEGNTRQFPYKTLASLRETHTKNFRGEAIVGRGEKSKDLTLTKECYIRGLRDTTTQKNEVK